MNYKTLIYILIGLCLTSCRYFGDEFDLFDRIIIDDEANWLLVIDNLHYDSSRLIFDSEVLNNYYSDLVLVSNEECGYSTPDNCLFLYKNGKEINSICYCSWIKSSIDFGRLKNEFIPAKKKQVNANTIKWHDFLLDSLKQLENIYLLYPIDTLIKFPDQLKFNAVLEDNGQKHFIREKKLEEEFKKIFNTSNFKVRAKWYSSSPGTPITLGYRIIVDCDSSFLNIFDKIKLEKTELFKGISDFAYKNKNFRIGYYEWN